MSALLNKTYLDDIALGTGSGSLKLPMTAPACRQVTYHSGWKIWSIGGWRSLKSECFLSLPIRTFEFCVNWADDSFNGFGECFRDWFTGHETPALMPRTAGAKWNFVNHPRGQLRCKFTGLSRATCFCQNCFMNKLSIWFSNICCNAIFHVEVTWGHTPK